MQQTLAKPTVFDLPKHTKVFPDADHTLKILTNGMHERTELKTRETNRTSDGIHFTKMTSTLGRKIGQLNRTIQNKKEIHFEKLSITERVNRHIDGNKEYFKMHGITR